VADITPIVQHSDTPALLVLALETSCDETAVAVLRGHELLASEVASQVAAHEKYGGVVPEIASRNHLIEAPNLVERALEHSGIRLEQVDAFAATTGPGLASSLMIGASIAKGMAIGFGKPYLAVNHLEGHLLSPFFGSVDPVAPNVGLIVSGGHTISVLVRDVGDYQIIGRTLDDAAGEAFDKVAKLLGLAYPGGPEIEKRAIEGETARFDFPRSMPESDDFSFSGLKTAVRYLLPKLSSPVSLGKSGEMRNEKSLDDKLIADVCASFQQAVIDVLVEKTVRVARRSQMNLITLSGGVSCNRELVSQFARVCQANGLQLRSAPAWLSTDNAAMIAFAASLHLKQGMESDVTQEIDPNLVLAR
jgi:N6-L-threonylcarbamoyladenine synthase